MRTAGSACLMCAAVALAAGVLRAEEEARTHVVTSGETLGQISQHYYGTTRYVDFIARANGLSDPNAIRPGQRLVIPPVTDAPISPPRRRAAEGPVEEGSPRPKKELAQWTLSDVSQWVRDTVNRLLAGEVPWWVVFVLPAAYLINVFVFWVGSNIVHSRRMTVGAAGTCGLLALLVWVGCVVLFVILWLSIAHMAGESPGKWPVLAVVLAVSLADLVGVLVVIKLVYRDTFGKTVALWVVTTLLGACFPILLLAACASPFAWLSVLLVGP